MRMMILGISLHDNYIVNNYFYIQINLIACRGDIEGLLGLTVEQTSLTVEQAS